MKPIIENGIISHYEDWKGEKTSAKHVFKQIKTIQKQQLLELKTKINKKIYKALKLAVKNFNYGKNYQNFNAYDLKRGQDLDTFVSNWKPSKPIDQIYW